jgi:hypothetical protein
MKLILSALALVLFLATAGGASAQKSPPPPSAEITVHTVEILDSKMYHPDYLTNATVVKSSDPSIPKGSIARLVMFRDPETRIFSIRVIGIVINDSLVPFSSGPATLSTGFFNKTGNAAKMRGDGHTPSLAGGQVFLPADTNINFMLSSSQ